MSQMCDALSPVTMLKKQQRANGHAGCVEKALEDEMSDGISPSDGQSAGSI
jgi:hypothetical protein